MRADATAEQIGRVVAAVEELKLTPHPLPGATRTAVGMTGNTAAVSRSHFEFLPGVENCIRVTKPYKLASREMKRDDTAVKTPFGTFGPGGFTVVAGPCSVETEELTLRTAEHLMSRGVRFLRAGAFKPRSSPYSFQGLGLEGLKILERVRAKTGIGIVTELMDVEHAEAVEAATDIIQIGTRNMQNFSLLKRVGQCRKPVLLKRGLSATLEEWLMAAEYVMAGGNYDVILCERGIRSYSDHSRNTLDLSVVPVAKSMTHLPVVVDPSHGVGKRQFVPAMTYAAMAAGADGVMLEAHPDPDHALSDGAQTIDLATLDAVLAKLKAMAPLFGRSMG